MEVERNGVGRRGGSIREYIGRTNLVHYLEVKYSFE